MFDRITFDPQIMGGRACIRGMRIPVSVIGQIAHGATFDEILEGYPDLEKELRIVTAKVPNAPARLAEQVTRFVQELRTAELYKVSGISETLDWISALVALDRAELDAATIEQTLGILLKNHEDIQSIRNRGIESLLNRASGGSR